MDGLAKERASKASLWRLAIVLAVCALFTPFFGPILDHHFPERQHDHAHIYLAKAVPHHNHPYQAAHVHSTGSGDSNTTAASVSSTQPPPGDIVFLLSGEGMGQDSAFLQYGATELRHD